MGQIIRFYENIILGGGASGLFCAANLNCQSKRSLLIEGNNKLGIKVLASGSGQCNLTHGGQIKNFLTKYGDKGSFIRKVLYSFSNEKVMDYFKSRGLDLLVREDGKVFPKSLKSRDVVDLLERETRKKGVEISLSTKIERIEKADDLFVLISNRGEKFSCKKLVVATGGYTYPKTGSDGKIIDYLKDNNQFNINIAPIYPALVPVYVENYPFENISGLSIRNVELTFESEGRKKGVGDLLFTHKNFSGPLIINNSRYFRPSDKIKMNYLNDFMIQNNMKEDELRALWKKNFSSEKSLKNLLLDLFSLPKNFVGKFLDIMVEEGLILHSDLGIKPKTMGEKKFKLVISKLLDHSFIVSGSEGFNKAMVSCGGVSLDDMDLKTMEHKKHPNLHFVGECLDVDGDTGGYNLQFAFSSGYIAAQHISQ